MKNRICKITALCLVLCLILSAFCACTQKIQIRFVDKDGNDRIMIAANTAQPAAPTATEPVTQTPESNAAAQTESAEASASVTLATEAPGTTEASSATSAPSTTAEPATAAAPEGSAYQPLDKKGNLYRADCTGKIWAKIVGSCYILFRDIDEPNEWTEKGKVYELYVTYVKIGENYSMWSDGYWELSADGTKLTLTPVNQGENGNVGVEAGGSKTFTANNGVFEIPVTFEQGGSTTVILDLSKPLS